MKKNLKKLLLLMAVVITAMVCLTFSAGAESYGTWEGYSYCLNDDGTVEILGYSGKETDLVVPGQIKGSKVTRIGGYSFQGSSVTSVVLPDTITSIGMWAFYECSNLTYVSMPEKLEYISYSVLARTKVESIYISKTVEQIGSGAPGYAIKNIYYQGSEADWANVAREDWYEYTHVAMHFNHKHTYKAVNVNGKSIQQCACGVVDNNLIDGVKTTKIALSKTAFTYNGKSQYPSVTVKDSKGNALKNGTDYKVSYAKGRTLPGRYAVKIDFMGKYSGTKTLYYTIAPQTTNKISTVQTSSTIKLTWNKVTGADGYRVYVYNEKNKKYDIVATVSGNSYLVKNLKSGASYNFKINSYKKAGNTVIWGKASAAVVATTNVAAPSGIKIAQNESAIKLTWNKVAGADGYRVYMYNTSTKKWVSQKTLTATSLMISKLKAGTTYQFKIIAYKKVGNTAVWGDYTAVIKASTRTTAPKITGVASTAKRRVAVSWSNVAGETGYELWASTKKDSGYKKVVTAKADVTKGIRTDFTSGRTYYFKVRAYRTVGNTVVYSAWSSAKALKVK